MIPSNWLGIVFFLILIAPGLLFDLLASRRRAKPNESAFREASRVVFASLIFSGFALFVLMIIQRVQPRLVPDPAEALRGGAGYVADHYNLVFGTLVLQLLLALGAAYAVHRALVRKHGGNIRATSTWTQVLRRDCPVGAEPHVRVRLSNGVVYTGAVANFTVDLDLSNRELVLAPPLFAKTGDRPWSDVPSIYQRVVLRGQDIEVLSVEYKRITKTSATSKDERGSAPHPDPPSESSLPDLGQAR